MGKVQLNLKIRPEAVAALRQKAAAEGLTLAATVERWLLGELPLEVAGEVAARLAVLEGKVAALEARSPGAGGHRLPLGIAELVAAPPVVESGGGELLVAAGDRIGTPELAKLLGIGRNALSAWCARNPVGSVRDGWRLVGRQRSPAGGPPRIVWERCAET